MTDIEQRTEENWGAEAWRKPTIKAGDVELFSEYGRIIGNVDYRSHWFVLVKSETGSQAALIVKHGGGEERIPLGYTSGLNAVKSFSALDSEGRYLTMHLLYRIHTEARRMAAEETRATYNRAFVDGRLKKRKLRGVASVKVWIEPAACDGSQP